MLGNKELKASLAEAQDTVKQHASTITENESRISELEASLATATESLEAATERAEALTTDLAEANGKVETLTADLEKAKADLESQKDSHKEDVAKEVENKLAAAAPDIPVTEAAKEEDDIASFEAEYQASREKGGAAHSKWMKDNKARISQYKASL